MINAIVLRLPLRSFSDFWISNSDRVVWERLDISKAWVRLRCSVFTLSPVTHQSCSCAKDCQTLSKVHSSTLFFCRTFFPSSQTWSSSQPCSVSYPYQGNERPILCQSDLEQLDTFDHFCQRAGRQGLVWALLLWCTNRADRDHFVKRNWWLLVC